MNVPVRTVAAFLDELHYLGAAKRGTAWSDEFGVLVLAKPTSRRLPQDGTWLELTRWCLLGERNSGSRQWKRVVRWLRSDMPHVTTVVSYSDPSVGHTGALYKACNWRWAPTWLRLRPPPGAHGRWSEHGKPQAVKDRWIYRVRPDDRRQELLAVQDESLVRRGCFSYVEKRHASEDSTVSRLASSGEVQVRSLADAWSTNGR